MRIAIAASEAVPFSKTGGLADVAGTLFKVFAGMGMDTRLFVPLYKKTGNEFGGRLRDTGLAFDVPLGRAVRTCRVLTAEDSRVFFIGNDEFFGRDELYGTPQGDYPDNDQRFVFFSRSVLEICRRLDLHIDIMHCNDWQTGLIPLYLKTLYRDVPALEGAVSVLTIHNLGYQGLFPPQTMEITGLGMDLFRPDGIEFYGKVNFLKAGLLWSDLITTVSETYAEEILTPEMGFGLDGVLRTRAGSLAGILNGIDCAEWNPATDKHIPANYDKADLSGKALCKKKLAGECGFTGDASRPLLCFVGRLSTQKGVDIFADAVPDIVAGANVLVIGKGDEHYHRVLGSLQDRFAGKFFFYTGFDEPFAHLAYAGADIFLMPSKYEPCGLGQMIAMRYGALPVARKTGGIADTVSDGVTGFLFSGYSAQSFLDALGRAFGAYLKRNSWVRMLYNGMSRDFSWQRSAGRYLKMYENALTARAGK